MAAERLHTRSEDRLQTARDGPAMQRLGPKWAGKARHKVTAPIGLPPSADGMASRVKQQQHHSEGQRSQLRRRGSCAQLGGAGYRHRVDGKETARGFANPFKR